MGAVCKQSVYSYRFSVWKVLWDWLPAVHVILNENWKKICIFQTAQQHPPDDFFRTQHHRCKFEVWLFHWKLSCVDKLQERAGESVQWMSCRLLIGWVRAGVVWAAGGCGKRTVKVPSVCVKAVVHFYVHIAKFKFWDFRLVMMKKCCRLTSNRLSHSWLSWKSDFCQAFLDCSIFLNIC